MNVTTSGAKVIDLDSRRLPIVANFEVSEIDKARLALAFLQMAGENPRLHLKEETAVRLAVRALRWPA